MVNPALKSKEAREGPFSFFQELQANDARAVYALADSACCMTQLWPFFEPQQITGEA
jgi:hypothetical protein